jgi:ribosomal protein S18 acetylase RimI-like enzyme
MTNISELTEASPSDLDSINQLLPQLSSKARPLTMDQLMELTGADSTFVLVCTNEETEIIGMLSLVILKIPTGSKAWIEDVVVDTKARGKGLGKALMDYALEKARKLGVKSIDLTSRPSREGANLLYQSLGYKTRETNVYRYNLS